MLKLIQLGLSFTDEKGNFAPGCSCWQFNFKFSLAYVNSGLFFAYYISSVSFRDDMFAQDSIDLLKASGIDFQKFAECGIDVARFGELMMMSGLILTEDVKWVSFHSGYDFGYLLKTLTCEDLPTDETAFIELLYIYFPCIYDIKVLADLVYTLLLYIFLVQTDWSHLVYDDCRGGYAWRAQCSCRRATGTWFSYMLSGIGFYCIRVLQLRILHV